jgi:carbamoyltransferase
MKLLSVGGITHDTNVTYYDGNNTHYLKLERIVGKKHFGIRDIFSAINKQKKHFQSPIDLIDFIIKKQWNVSINEIDDIIFEDTYVRLPKNISLINHHLAHALSVSFLHDVEKNIVIDGRGPGYLNDKNEMVSNSWHVYYKDNLIEKGITEQHGSIGMGITSMSYKFEKLRRTPRGLDRAGKLMGLQSYGNINYDYYKTLKQYDIYQVEACYNAITNNVNSGNTIFSIQKYKDFINKSELLSYQERLDWIRTVHERCGEIILELFKKHVNLEEKVGYSGGVAQNVIWNTLLKKHFPNLVVVPYASDEGLSIGGMEFLRRKHNLPKMSFNNFPYCSKDEHPNSVLSYDNSEKVAQFLSEGKIVALYQGNGEVGPRALGNRSILFDPRIQNGKQIINTVKNREYYRPFGASVLEEHKDLFGLEYENPYMLYVGYPKISVPAITHVDGTCRVQTVSQNDSALRYILESFYEKTQCPALLNTSLNISGKPIVGDIESAMQEYESKNIDVIVVGNNIIRKI